MKPLAPGAPGPYGMHYPDLPDEPETLINPHYPAIARVAEEVITTCAELAPAERRMLEQEDIGLWFSSIWPLAGQDELCARIPLYLFLVMRDDRLDRGDAGGAADLGKAIARKLERLLAPLQADPAQRIRHATEAVLERAPRDSFNSLDAYLEYKRGGEDSMQLAAELSAAGAGRTYAPLLDVPETQEFLCLHSALARLANDILGAPREMSQKGDRINAVALHQRLTGCTAQQALDACLELYHSMRERYHRVRRGLSRQEEFEQMCTDLHLVYSGTVFFMKRSLRYHRCWTQTAW